MDNHSVYSFKKRDESIVNDITEVSLSASVKQYINGLYDDIKKCFEQKNFARIEKLTKNISNVDPESNILNVIRGTYELLNGNGTEAYKYLFTFAQNSTSVDLWALNSMAMWNLFAGQYELSLHQFSQVINGDAISRKFLVTSFIYAIKTKKRLGFLDKALEYFERISRVPEGYKMILIIKLEIIHIHILKKNYDKALQEIEAYTALNNNFFLKRLKVYIFYLKKHYKEILRYRKDTDLDPYIAYIIARVGLENDMSYNIDIPYFLDTAIKAAKGNEYFYNTYGNYYYLKNRYTDSAEHYNNALARNPKFEPAMYNLHTFLISSVKSGQHPIYINNQNIQNKKDPYDVDPDVEELGFFDHWKLLGYSTFKADTASLRKSPSLKFYIAEE